jgi:DNA-binding response OmpR family regulator
VIHPNSTRNPRTGRSNTELRFGPLLLDPEHVQAFLHDRCVNLTRVEFGLLHHLATNANRIVPSEELVSRVMHGVHRQGSSLVRVHVCRMRQKLGVAAVAIRTVRGRGFRFEAKNLVTSVPPAPHNAEAPRAPEGTAPRDLDDSSLGNSAMRGRRA